MQPTRLLVCDLDNTLYDWVGYFVPAFYAMVDVALGILNCDREQLLDDFKAVHQRAHDSEHPFSLLETATVQKRYGNLSWAEMSEKLDSAFHAFNSIRKRNLALYPEVRETLDVLKAANITLVAHTESKLHGVVDRLRRLDIQTYFSRIYCRERSTATDTMSHMLRPDWLDGFPMDRVIELSHHQSKPNRSVLLEICERENISSAESAYIGDSIAKDVMMAKHAGVYAIWAEYGARHSPDLYEKLVRVSHWTPEEVAYETRLREEARSIKPDYIARRSFSEVRAALGLVRPTTGAH